MIREIVKGMWQFARFLFVPRWGRRSQRENRWGMEGERTTAKPSSTEKPEENNMIKL